MPRGRWGAPELVLRFSHDDLDDDVVQGGSFDKTSLGINWWATRQVAGAIAAGFVLYLIASGKPDFSVTGHWLAANGFGDHSPGTYSLGSAVVTEVVLTMMFLFVIMGSTDERAPKGFAPIAIGLCLTLIHLIGIPVTNLSVNPARSTAPAVIVGGWALAQLWVFWVAPMVGAVVGGAIYPWVAGAPRADAPR